MTTTSFWDKATEIYQRLEDDESKDVFMCRLQYSITNDIKNINEIVKKYLPHLGVNCLPNKAKDLNSRAKKTINDSNSIIIYGAGKIGQTIADILRNVSVKCYVDINVDLQNTTIKGLHVISPEKFISSFSKNGMIILAVWPMYQNDLIELFVSHGINRENIINGLDFVELKGDYENQYFEPDIIKYSNEEVFVDAGSYDFRTSLKFADRCNSAKKIYAFDPDKENIKKCRKAIDAFDICPVVFFDSALWSRNEILNFNSLGGGGSTVLSSGNTQVSGITLDSVVGYDKITFIKMDIEGSELEALKGSTETIKRCKPKLAISVYHKPEDIIDILKYIIDLECDYKLFLRHYTNWSVDTVLYAIS